MYLHVWYKKRGESLCIEGARGTDSQRLCSTYTCEMYGLGPFKAVLSPCAASIRVLAFDFSVFCAWTKKTRVSLLVPASLCLHTYAYECPAVLPPTSVILILQITYVQLSLIIPGTPTVQICNRCKVCSRGTGRTRCCSFDHVTRGTSRLEVAMMSCVIKFR